MSIKIDMVYSENPYVDIIVYNAKLLAINTVLKLKDAADAKETLESKKNADTYIACMENTMIFDLFDSFSEDVLRKSGLIGSPLLAALINKDNIPANLRDTVLANAKIEYIEKYEELNDYYRMLAGIPPVGYTDLYLPEEIILPDTVIIDRDIPIYQMDIASIGILDNYGILDELYDMDPTNRGYLKYLLRKIEPYAARKAGSFDILYIPSIESSDILNEYKERLEINRVYALRTVYSEAFKYGSDYYDNFIAVFIVLNAMLDIITRVNEFITRKEVFDIRTVRYIFESYGVTFFPEIPMKYQLGMVKNLHTLLKYKSTPRCMIEICSLFGFNNIDVFKYYLLRTHRYNAAEDTYSFTGIPEQDFELQFVKIPIDEGMDDYIRDATYRVGYDEITAGDPTWDGGLLHDDVKRQHLTTEFNYIRTKYLSVDSLYDIARVSIQQSYFFNMLYDNMELETEINLRIPYISSDRAFNISDIFTFLTCLTYQYNNVKDMIMDTQGKILTIYGFNFRADLAQIAADLSKISDKPEIRAVLNRFNIPAGSIPNMNQLMSIFTSNLDVRSALVTGMKNADNLQIYNAYKYLYDSLMTMELTLDHFKDPETGDFYRDAHGDATYTEFLRHKDSTLYYRLSEIEMMEDDENKTNYIATLIDNIVYILEEYIDTEEFSGIFQTIPVVSIDAVKQYIKTVIDFYKSYKVHFLGINTLYYFDDPYEGWIKMIDTAILQRWFQKEDVVPIVEKIAKMSVKITESDKIKIRDQIYLDISTWNYSTDEDRVEILDAIMSLLAHMGLDDEFITSDSYMFISNIERLDFYKLIEDFDRLRVTEDLMDNLDLKDSAVLNVFAEG